MERELARSSAALALEEAEAREAAAAGADRHRRRVRAEVEKRRWPTTWRSWTATRSSPCAPTWSPASARTSGASRRRRASSSAKWTCAIPMVMLTHGFHWFDKGWMATREPREPHSTGGAALQPVRHAHGGLRHCVRGADAPGRNVRCAAPLARADLHPRRGTCRSRARRPPDARQPLHARAGVAVRVRQHPARLAEHEGQPGTRASSICTFSSRPTAPAT